MTQLQYPAPLQRWGAFLPQLTVQVRHPQMGGMVSVGDGQASFQTARRTSVAQGLGQSTGQGLYNRAKAAVSDFDTISTRALRIANKTVRDQIISDFGLDNPSNKDKAAYMRSAVNGDIVAAERYNPINYYLFEAPGPAKSRPGKLESFNQDFKSAVASAEVTYGILPEPVTTTITNTISSPLTVPILIGAGIVAAALLLS